jgi:uncharacterized protein (DUF433 family)
MEMKRKPPSVGDDNSIEKVKYALRFAIGRYDAERASQLSGIPRSTVYEWRRHEAFIPDYDSESPVAWSYRDLVFLRLLAFLRQAGMPRPSAVEEVSDIKGLVANGHDIRFVHAGGLSVLIDGEDHNRFNGIDPLPFDNVTSLLHTFDLLTPITEIAPDGRDLWLPSLLRPSTHTAMSPWVMGGEPCVNRTRIPTASIHALRVERGLSVEAIAALYPGLERDAAVDADVLERRLRGLGADNLAA